MRLKQMKPVLASLAPQVGWLDPGQATQSGSRKAWDHQGKSRHERGYGAAWVKTRDRIMRRDKYLCQVCLADDRPTPANEVDHITPKAAGGTDDDGNLQAICTACHKDKTKREHVAAVTSQPHKMKLGYSIPFSVKPSAIPVTLVCGPPGAGKTTWVRDRAAPCDLVIDFDAYRAQVGGRNWDNDPDVMRKAYALRDADIRSLSKRTEGRAWLIAMAPTKRERDQWLAALGEQAQAVVLAVSMQECIRRIKADASRRDAAATMIEAVAKWWAAHDQ